VVKRLLTGGLALVASLAFATGAARASDVNLALAENGGTVTVSSENSPGSSAGLNDGVRQTSGWWTASTSVPGPGWAEISWDSPQTISSVILRMPVTGDSYADRLHQLIRVQYWDGTAWEDVDATGNPIVDWLVPTTDDGTQNRTLTFSPITTRRVRFYEERGNLNGHYGLEEIEVWGPQPACVDNLALAAAGGRVTVSSENPGAYASGLNDGIVQTAAWWSAAPWAPGVQWAQISWDSARTLTQFVLRMPVVDPSHPLVERTFELLRLQYWTGSRWEDVDATGNPIEDWVVPTTDDGTQIRTFTFAAIETEKIRVYFEGPNGYGDSGLEEIEAYASARRCQRNVALAANGGRAIASSSWAGGSLAALNDGVVQTSGYWASDPWASTPPHWAGISWSTPRTLSRVVIRMPVVPPVHSVPVRTFGELRLQSWDGSRWEDVASAGNPIEAWLIPTVDDGTQIRTLSFAPLTTAAIRILFVTANSVGDAGLEEIEAWT
jgi:hypothetical protein